MPSLALVCTGYLCLFLSPIQLGDHVSQCPGYQGGTRDLSLPPELRPRALYTDLSFGLGSWEQLLLFSWLLPETCVPLFPGNPVASLTCSLSLPASSGSFQPLTALLLCKMVGSPQLKEKCLH